MESLMAVLNHGYAAGHSHILFRSFPQKKRFNALTARNREGKTVVKGFYTVSTI
jgi:hypothetical protein